MSSMAQIVNELMEEFGKTAPEVGARISQKVGEITIDLLSQNGSRFKGLEKTTTLTINTTDTSYALPANFCTAQPTFLELDSSGEFVRELEIVSQAEFYRRKSEARFTEHRLCFIEWRTETTGRLAYLVLGTAPTTATTYKFFYWREAHAGDTDLIKNPAIVKKGVRAGLSDLNPNYMADLAAYNNMRVHFRENVMRTTTSGVQLKPSLRTQRHNLLMHKIGGGG